MRVSIIPLVQRADFLARLQNLFRPSRGRITETEQKIEAQVRKMVLKDSPDVQQR